MTPPAAANLLEAPPAEEQSTAPIPSASPQPTAPASEPEKPKRSGARTAARGLWASFKFLVLLAVVGGLVVAAIVGWPYLRDRLYEDVDANTARIAELDAQLAAADQTITDLQAQLDTLGQRQDEVPTRLDELAARQDTIADEQAATGRALTDLELRVAGLDDRAGTFDQQLLALDESSALLGGELANQREIARATELLSRARLFLYQANYGLAISDLTAAQNVLARVDPSKGGIDPEVHAAATERIALALAALPDRPVLAADDLDIAWQMLVADQAAPVVAPIVASNPPVPPATPVPEATADGDVTVTDGSAPAADGTTPTP